MGWDGGGVSRPPASTPTWMSVRAIPGRGRPIAARLGRPHPSPSPPSPPSELAPEAATAYHRYGEALLLVAQADTDVFGARVKAAADERAAARAAADAAAAAGEEAPGVDAAGKENSKGKARAVEPEGEGADEGDDASSSDADAPTADGDDTDLAWQMLDTARAILCKLPARGSELADVHVALGDVAAEQERFDAADAEYGAALGLLDALGAGAGRRGGEAHYKRCLARQLAGAAAAALESATAAVACVAAAAAAEPGDAGLAEVLADLKAKAAELEAPAKEVAEMKAMVAAALTAATGGSGGAFDAPAGGGGGGSGVQDLGVVGRGAKRVCLAPAGPAPASTAPRSLDSLMGGPVPVPAGFGGAAVAAPAVCPADAAASVAAAAPAPKPAPAPGVVPAFLAPGAVAAVYGEEGKGKAEGE